MRVGTRMVSLCVCVALTVSFSGCNKNTEQEDKKADEVNMEDNADIATLREWAKDNKWQTQWLVEKDDENVEIIINANVTVPEVDSLSVVEVENLSMIGGGKGKMLTELFDDGICYYYDDEHKTKEMWMREIDKEKNYSLEAEYHMSAETSEVDRQMWEEIYEEYHEKIKKIEEKMKGAPDNKEQVVKFDQAVGKGDDWTYEEEYVGMIDNKPYVVRISKNMNGMTDEILNISPYDKSECYPGEIKNGFGITIGYDYDDNTLEYKKNNNPDIIIQNENQCTISEEEAKKYAMKYLEKLGVSNMDFVEKCDIYWDGKVLDENDGKCKEYLIREGYLLRFSLYIDNKNTMDLAIEQAHTTFEDAEEYENFDVHSMYTAAEVEVNDGGIISIRLDNPVKVTNVTENVKLLSLNCIMDIVKDYIDNTAQTYRKSAKMTKHYNDLELTHFRVTDKNKENVYSYIPVWKLSDAVKDDMGMYDKKHTILINAMDGKLININEEFMANDEYEE